MSVKFSKEIAAEKAILKNFGTPHGYSQISITIMDQLNRNLDITMEFDNTFELEEAFDYIVASWKKYAPIKSFIRSYKIEGKYQKEFNGYELKSEAPFPDVMEHFYYEKDKKYDIIIDIEKHNDDYTCKLYRFREDKPRVLIFSLVM